MKLKIIWVFIIGSSLLQLSCNPEGPEEPKVPELDTVKGQTSYYIGQQLAMSVMPVSSVIDEDSLLLGIKDALAENTPRIDPQISKKARQEYNSELQKAAADWLTEKAENNRNAAVAFLEKNRAREGVTVTESGLQYEVLREGKGDHPKSTDTVKVQYSGTLVDGTEIDSTYKRGGPASLPLDRLIPGWAEGIQLMQPGAKYKFYIPPQLAYGEKGKEEVGPNEALIFEVELLEIKKK